MLWIDTRRVIFGVGTLTELLWKYWPPRGDDPDKVRIKTLA